MLNKSQTIGILFSAGVLYTLNAWNITNKDSNPKPLLGQTFYQGTGGITKRNTLTLETPPVIEVKRKPNKFPKQTDHWKIIRKGEKQFAVFSAYYDVTKKWQPKVRITAAGNKNVTSENSSACVLYVKRNTVMRHRQPKFNIKHVKADVINTFEWRNRFPFAGRIIECRLKKQEKPDEVSVVLGPNTEPNRIKVHSYTLPERNGTMCACLKHLFNFDKYNQILDLIEYIEFYKLMGVDHFYIYVLSVSEWIRRVILRYEERGEVTPVFLDIPPHIVIEEEYQFLLNTDCMLRSRARCEYTVTCDSDEFLMPRKYNDLKEFVKKEDRPEIGSYCFTNAYFDPGMPDDIDKDNPYNSMERPLTFASGFPVRLRTVLKVYRGVPKTYKVDRCKCVSKSATVDQMGIHAVKYFVSPETRSKFFAADVGLMHHYRRKDWVGFPFPNSTKEAYRDTTMLRIGKKLLENVGKIIKKFNL